MNNKLKMIREMCKNLGMLDGKTSDEYLFTLRAVDIFYFNGNIGKIDIKAGFVDGPNDGGIDFIYCDTNTMYLIQGKSGTGLSIDDIKNAFRKMHETINNFADKKYDQYSNQLKSSYLNAYDDLNDDKNIELILFTNTILTEDTKKKIMDFSESEEINNFSISMYDQNDIDTKEVEGNELIKEDYILINIDRERNNNFLGYGDSGLIVNVKASSIQRLYIKYGLNGLFSYNLREHIVQKNVDDAIDNTINKEKDKFWFYNNGITIGCSDFRVDGYKIKLYDFSIINGAQTTTKIGKSKSINEANDFFVVCKIVKAESSSGVNSEFIAKISEASNSQKPIKQRDLKSNAIEQKKLQRGCENNGKLCLAVEIKRGVKPENYKKVDKWQRVTNEYIGQLIYACILQRPGPARNAKNAMFSSKNIYKQIFLRKHDYDTLYDLVRLGKIYDDYVSEEIVNERDLDKIAIAKNGKFTILGVIIYLYKREIGILTDYTSDQLHKDNIKGLLITDYIGDDLDERVKELFKFVIRFLGRLYETKKESMKITSYSNFFKAENIYDIILKQFDELDEWDKEKLLHYMEVFTEKKQLEEV